MAEQTSWWGRMLATVSREYERRVRAASLVTEYGAAHQGHQSHDDDQAEAAEIINVPRGARLRPAHYTADEPAGPEAPAAH
jgi:hypothetical protein